MAGNRVVAVLVGSLRKDSWSRKVARALMAEAPSSLSCRIVEIGDLALYNEDLEGHVPPSWARFRSEMKTADAVLFVTPEYNRSIPGVLKNAVDVGSRPADRNVFAGRPAGVVSVTPYTLGAFGANHHLRQTFVFLDMPVMQQPEAYIGEAGGLFDDKGELTSDETRRFLQKYMGSFLQWVEKVARPSAPSRSFQDFMKRRADVARAYVNGDGAPLEGMVPHSGTATFFPPFGGAEQGAEAVATRYQRDVRSFSPGGETSFDILQTVDGDVGVWTGFQSAKVRMQGSDPREMKLRVTEVFRRIGGDWKLVHRHADPLAEPQAPARKP
jgi:NAD(P)H-dependent FMN reductase/ketosteroid isomerase-like protein